MEREEFVNYVVSYFDNLGKKLGKGSENYRTLLKGKLMRAAENFYDKNPGSFKDSDDLDYALPFAQGCIIGMGVSEDAISKLEELATREDLMKLI